MKIAIIAPPWIKLPTHDYTGIEIVISGICEKLIDAGHEVILFAPKGSTSAAKIIPYPKNNTGIDWNKADESFRSFINLVLAKYASAKACALKCNIIHNFTLTGELENNIPALYTVFGPPTSNIVKACKKISKFSNNYLVTVSNRQRVSFNDVSSKINFIDTVPKSIDIDKVIWNSSKEDYFLFIGHKEQTHGLNLARRVSNKAGKRLIAVIQGKTNQLFTEEIKPWLNNSTNNLNLQFIEDMPTEARYNLYRKAKGTFYINKWEDPFGMEMLESLACGTPVIALRKGATSEVIKHNQNGFLVETEKEMLEAVKNIDNVNSTDCRKYVEENFSSEKITKKYLEIYNSLIS